jgi:hypothetical protein
MTSATGHEVDELLMPMDPERSLGIRQARPESDRQHAA